MQRFASAVFVGVLVAVALTGCQKTIKAQDRTPTKLVKLEQSVSVLSPVVSLSLPQGGGRFNKGFNKKDVPDLHVAQVGELLIAVSRSGVVSAYQGQKAVWSVDVKEAISSGVGADLTTVVVGTRAGELVAMDAKTGDVLWKRLLSSSSLTPSLVADDRVLVSTNDGVLYGLDKRTGDVIWQFGTQVPSISVRGLATPLHLDKQTVLFGTADGRIHAINPQTGTPLWTRRVGHAVGGSQVHRMSDVDGQPLVVDNHLYVASYSGQLMGFDMSTGQALFVRELASVKPLTAYGNWVIGSSVDGDVLAFDRLTGQEVWKNSELKYRKLTNPVVIGEHIFVGDFDGVVHVFDKQGKIISRTQTKGALTSLQTQNHKLYAQSADGVVNVWQAPKPALTH